MTLNIGGHAQPGNITVDVAFSIPSGTISRAGIELLEIIDPWSDRINAHTLGFGIIDDVDSNIPVEIESGIRRRALCIEAPKLNASVTANTVSWDRAPPALLVQWRTSTLFRTASLNFNERQSRLWH